MIGQEPIKAIEFTNDHVWVISQEVESSLCILDRQNCCVSVFINTGQPNLAMCKVEDKMWIRGEMYTEIRSLKVFQKKYPFFFNLNPFKDF